MAGIGGLGEILGRLAAPVADDVARAAAEFGDDAVRSIMKTTPAMRKRLAALAEKRLSSDSVISDIGGRNIQKDATAIERYLTKHMTPDSVKNRKFITTDPETDVFGDALTTLDGWKKGSANGLWDIPSTVLQDLPKKIGEEATALSRLGAARNNFTPGSTLFDRADDAYKDAVNSIISGRVSPYIADELTAAARADRLNEVIDNLPRLASRVQGFPRYPAVASQTDLAALLRMIGDAQ
jgi:hypothetical protein